MSERKKASIWVWVVAVFIGLPVLYALAWGPVFAYQIRHPSPGGGVVDLAFDPLKSFTINAPGFFADPYLDYLEWWHRMPIITDSFHGVRSRVHGGHER